MAATDTWVVVGGVTGVVGALAAVLTLVWTIAGHRRGGRRVSVRSSYNIPVYGPPGQPEFHDDDQVAVAVSHRGGAAVTVTNYGVGLRRKFWDRRGKTNMFVTNPPVWATQPGTMLSPGGKPLEFLVPVADLRRIHEEEGIPYRRMRGWVNLGDGRRIYSSNHVPLK